METDDDPGSAPEGHLEGIGYGVIDDDDPHVDVGPPFRCGPDDGPEVGDGPLAGIPLTQPSSRIIIIRRNPGGEEDEGTLVVSTVWKVSILDDGVDVRVDDVSKAGEDGGP